MTAAATQPITLYTFRLPFPPSINELYATVNGRRVKSKAGRAYVLNVEAAILSQLQERPYLPLNTPLVIDIEFHKPTLFNWDWDGTIKALQDAIFYCCNKSGCVNDAWIVQASVRKIKSNGEKYAVVRIGEAA